ncbi:hypothetical protein ABH926_005435 [Catenulispora sp. GP43]|uniref:hypothetical protein n=1 Tax=Catenulispora sp. GP43 TaxID=3156263 RepID=UPI003511D46C
MTIDIEHLLAAMVVVRIGSADLWTIVRRLLSAGVRIGAEEQLAHRGVVGTVRITYGTEPSEIGGSGI